MVLLKCHKFTWLPYILLRFGLPAFTSCFALLLAGLLPFQLMATKPEVSYSDIGGNDIQKQEVNELRLTHFDTVRKLILE